MVIGQTNSDCFLLLPAVSSKANKLPSIFEYNSHVGLQNIYYIFLTGYVLSLPVIASTLPIGVAFVLLSMALIIYIIIQRTKTKRADDKNR